MQLQTHAIDDSFVKDEGMDDDQQVWPLVPMEYSGLLPG